MNYLRVISVRSTVKRDANEYSNYEKDVGRLDSI